MSVLTIVQQFCERTQLPVPQTVIGNSDPQVRQIKALLTEEGNALAMRGDWEILVREVTHTTLAQEDQGFMTTIASGFRYICNETMWDRTDMLPVPQIGSSIWQRLKAVVSSGPRYKYRIRGGKLLINPTPPADHTLAFEYLSKNWVSDVAGNLSTAPVEDDATTLLPEQLILMGLRWRWKKEHGLEYAEDFRDYEMQVADYLGRDGGKPVLQMDGAVREPRPGIFVPEGNWSL